MNFTIDRIFAQSGIILTGLTGLFGIATPTLATTISMTNPCPGIYYEEPHNSLHIVPSTCPPNAATRFLNRQNQRLNQQPPLPPGSAPATMLQPPLSPPELAPIGTVQLQTGQVNVQLKNMTNTPITYAAVGHMPQRTLGAKADLLLQDLPTPVTLTFLRPDTGFVRVTMAANAESGALVLLLDEAMDLSNSQTSVRIQSDGDVLAY
jgi:hypothetical protein